MHITKNQKEKIDYIKNKYKLIIIWGLKRIPHTHRYIHLSFYKNLKRLNIPTLWLDDSLCNQKYLTNNSLVLTVGLSCQHLIFKKNIDYCLHNCDKTNFKQDSSLYHILNLQVYIQSAENDGLKWNETTYFNRTKCILYQPWGTDLLPQEFKKPVFNHKSHTTYWIGSIWNNDLNQGNKSEIKELVLTLNKYNLKFNNPRYPVPGWLNILLIRKSRLAPAIAGQWQVENGYLSCRMFKNISYGQLGLSNVSNFQKLLKETFIHSNNIEQLIEKALHIQQQDYLDLVTHQQNMIKNHTYLEKIFNITKALEEIKK